MEVVDGNGEHSIDGNEEQVVKEIDDNDSCTVDLEANGGQEPNIGMEFDSQENAYSFYTHYAKSVGFGISIKNSRRSKISREFIDVIYACTRYGKKRESSSQNPRPCLKVGCEASLRIKRISDGKWIVHSFVKYHNHKLFPAYAHYFPCHRGINKAQKHSIETLHHVGVRTTKIFATMAKEYGGGYENIGCLEKDVRNHLDKGRRLALESFVKEHNDNLTATFTIFDFHKNDEFIVECDVSKKEISCLCRFFEYNGYLCRHSLMAFQAVGVCAVPSHYILRRWTNDVRSKHLTRIMKEDACSSKERYDSLYQKAIEFLEEGLLSFESYNLAYHALEETLKQCATINRSLKIEKENVGQSSLRVKLVRDPKRANTKGAPRRIKSGIERGRKRTSSCKVKKSAIVQREAVNTSNVLNGEVTAALPRMENHQG